MTFTPPNLIVGQAEDETKLWDMALLTPYQLGSLKFFSFYVDLSAVASYGAWAEFVLQPTGAFKVTSTTATFSTAEGHEVAIDSTANKGTIRFGSGSLAGGSYSIAEALPQGAARKLLEEEPSRTPTIERVTTEYVFRMASRSVRRLPLLAQPLAIPEASRAVRSLCNLAFSLAPQAPRRAHAPARGGAATPPPRPARRGPPVVRLRHERRWRARQPVRQPARQPARPSALTTRRETALDPR